MSWLIGLATYIATSTFMHYLWPKIRGRLIGRPKLESRIKEVDGKVIKLKFE